MDEDNEMRLRTSRSAHKKSSNSKMHPKERNRILAATVALLGADLALITLACFWREPFLKVLTYYGVGSVFSGFILCRLLLGLLGESNDDWPVGCWPGLWALMGLPCCVAAILISNWL